MTFAFGFLCGIWFCMILAFILGLVKHYAKPNEPVLPRCIDCNDPIEHIDWRVAAPEGNYHMDCYEFGGRY